MNSVHLCAFIPDWMLPRTSAHCTTRPTNPPVQRLPACTNISADITGSRSHAVICQIPPQQVGCKYNSILCFLSLPLSPSLPTSLLLSLPPYLSLFPSLPLSLSMDARIPFPADTLQSSFLYSGAIPHKFFFLSFSRIKLLQTYKNRTFSTFYEKRTAISFYFFIFFFSLSFLL